MRNYSLGMRQRTKLAQAIAHDPELLILDEPFNGLDPMGRIDMTQFLSRWRTRGKSLILASHILHEVEAVKPSFLLISGGRLLASGSPDHVRSILIDTPNTLRIRTRRARELSGMLMNIQSAICVRIIASTTRDDTQIVEVETLSSVDVFNALPKLVADSGIDIIEIQSADESLKHLFSTLMRIHRGEAQGGSLT
jgi:ABC-2 type transport system ATP-binding protein